MATVRTQGGSVLLRNGAASCTCCEDIQIILPQISVNLGSPGDCDCDEKTIDFLNSQILGAVYCYGSDQLTIPIEGEENEFPLINRQLSPASVTIGGITYPNDKPNSNVFQLGADNFPDSYSTILQGAIFGPSPETGQIVFQGWNNIVNEPSVVRLTGQVGGDIAIWHLQLLTNNYGPTFNDEWGISGLIPNEGEFPCGYCEVPRNGSHNIDVMFTIFPNTYVWINALSYLTCFPWFSLRLRRVGPAAP
jgi:hypothetical protein